MNSIIEEKLREIEDTGYFEFMFEAAKMFEEVAQISRELKVPEVWKKAEREAKLLSLMVYNPIIDEDYKQRFHIQSSQFSKEDIKYFENRLEESSNIFLKNRYSDFLLEYGEGITSKKKFEIGKLHVELVIQTAEAHFEKGQYLSSIEDFARAVNVSLHFNNKELVNKSITSLFNIFLILPEKESRWFLEASKIARQVISGRMKEIVNEETRKNIYEKLEQGREFFWNCQEHHLHRVFCEELIQWVKANKIDPKKIEDYLRGIGDSYEAESEHQQGRAEKTELVKAHFLEEALQHSIRYGFTDKFDDLKLRIKKSYEQAKENGEFIPISTSVKISKKDLQKEFKPYLDVKLEEAILYFGREATFIPDIERIRKDTIEQSSIFSLRNLMSRSIVSDGKKIFQAVDDEDNLKVNLNENYMRYMQTTAVILMAPLFEELIERGLNAQHIIDQINNWEYIGEENKEFIKVGVERLFEKDYISSLHILVPQFEDVIRGFFHKLGFVTTSIKKGTAQHEQTFNEFLERQDIKEVLPERTHKYIQILMVEQTGSNLRNKIAHGLINSSECNLMNNILVLHLYLVLTTLTISVKEKDE
ncbi:DUF4209 domain-containing protein [Priestia megaterium]|uniref:DUF4209 domain-containing protein n=1 Tax=Priestia megaterium TaxID=1404 RepID=A0ABD4WSD7_PRIMG|nr:DUF4209 domain-containing protein [Priestia megaterium]MDD9783130.1 DUF4209 domain-containing protein [Priestia megaterium]